MSREEAKLAYSCKLKYYPMSKPPIIKTNVAVFIVTGLIALVGMPLWAINYGFDAFEILVTVVLFFFTGMSITAGYHRLWAHKAFDAHPAVRLVLAIGGAMTLQNSILHWCSDHREHHKHVDHEDKDPYSAKKGLWYSHIGWMIREYNSNPHQDYQNCKDLKKDRIVMWQHKYYLLIVLAANFGITGLLGWLNGDVMSMILLAGVFRLAAVHHVTFFINSLAHFWGSQPYTDKNTARDNGILAFFTFGEGYHNYHHIFEYDYRNGIHWWQYDPTKWLIFCLSRVGLAKNLRRCPEERIEKAKLEMQLLKAQNEFKKYPNAEALLEKLHKEYELMSKKLVEYYATRREFLKQRGEVLRKGVERLEMDYKFKEVKQAFKLQREKWQAIVALSPAMAQ